MADDERAKEQGRWNPYEIRAELGAADMSRDDMLSALVGMPFSQWVEACRSSVREGRIEPFE